MTRIMLLIILTVLVAMLAGIYIGEYGAEPQVVTIERTKTQVVNEYIIVPDDPQFIEYPVYVDREIEVPQQLRNFETATELKRWLDDTPIIMPAWKGADCDDWTMHLIERATQDGYYMYFYPDLYNLHFKCCAIAGNNVYLIEPQNHEIELYMLVD